MTSKGSQENNSCSDDRNDRVGSQSFLARGLSRNPIRDGFMGGTVSSMTNQWRSVGKAVDLDVPENGMGDARGQYKPDEKSGIVLWAGR